MKNNRTALFCRMNDFVFQLVHLQNKHAEKFGECSHPDCIYARKLLGEIKQILVKDDTNNVK